MNSSGFSKILIIATRQIGDTLITTPLIKRTYELWPKAQIDFLGFHNATGILEGNPYLNKIIGSNPKPKLTEYFQLFTKIFNHYDLAIITQPSDRAYLYGLFAAPNRVGVCHVGKEDRGWKKWITLHQVPINYFHQHVVTEKLRLLEPFTQENQFSQAVQIDPPKEVAIPHIVDDIVPFSVVVHPSPLNAYKRWPLASWISLIEYLTSQNIPVLISGGNSQVDMTLAQKILEGLSSNATSQTINLTGQISFSELAAILKKAKAYVGIDTSVTHLAASCAIPTVALFGATPPTNFGPWPNGFKGVQPFQLKALSQTVGNITILQGPNDCVPCRKAGCEDYSDSKSICLEELSVSRVIQTLQALLSIH